MAVPSLPKLKPLKLTKLQALLLLGGAFVLAAAIWVLSVDQLVPDASTLAPKEAVFALRLLRQDSAVSANQGWAKFRSSLPPEAQKALSQAGNHQPLALFATANQNGVLTWNTADPTDSSQAKYKGSGWRLVPRSAQAIGFVKISGKKQPYYASFDQDKAVFQVGRSYIGMIPSTPSMTDHRRMIRPMSQMMAYVEKPDGVSWKGATSILTQQMQRFSPLSAFWGLPGRVELSVSASRTDETLQPFVLYYHPAASSPIPRVKIETIVKNLMISAFPHAVQVQLPDGSHMQELRFDKTGLSAEKQTNRFGDIVKYAFPSEKNALYGFYSLDKEVWLSGDLGLVQSAILGNVDQAPLTDVCQADGLGGNAVVPGSFLPFQNGFSSVALSIHNLETGMFTMCGYY